MDHSTRPMRHVEGLESGAKDASLSGNAASDGAHLGWTGLDEDPQNMALDSYLGTGKRTREEISNGDQSWSGDGQSQFVPGGHIYRGRPAGHQEEPSPKRRKSQSLPVGYATERSVPLHGLTLPVWQKILGFVPPVYLGRLLREFSLHCSDAFPSFLIPALHFCFITDSMDAVSATTLRDSSGPSPSVQKFYYQPHLQQLLGHFENAKNYGQASVEEWMKGLESQKKQEAADIARWEQWEAKGGLKKVNARPATKSTPPTRQSSNSTIPSRPDHTETGNGTSLTLGTPARAASPQVPYATSQALAPSSSMQMNGLPQRPYLQAQPNPRPERNIRDVNEAKAARRMEIEKRAMGLEPPITPNLLFHMSSFQAALQITTPLTDHAWEVLKPRLLAQRSEAELLEQERYEQNRNLMARLDDPSQQDGVKGEASDRQWETIQAPVREILGQFADEIIEAQWAGGRNLTKDSRPNFAADVLLYCRRKYYEDADQRKASNSTSFLPSKLVLENMKWLFDHKVRDHTEGSHRELFLCNGCEGNSKFYGFEAVIQHYAAKHTSSLSLGSVIVHWRAEWPEEPPFHPNPVSARNAFYSLSKSVATGLQNLPALQAPPQNAPNPYAHGWSSESLSGTTTMFPVSSFSDQASTYNAASSTIFTPPTPFQTMAHPPQPVSLVSSGHYAPSPQLAPGPQPQPTALGPTYQYVQTNTGPALYHPAYYQNNGLAQPTNTNLDLHQHQMMDMAQIAREIWYGIAGIKEMPQSVRIYIVIQHVVTRFEKLYTKEPTLSMFIDGLDHNTQMRPVRSLNGLACKACVATSQQQASGPDSQSRQLGDRRLYTLPHLLNHFRSSHLERDHSGMDTAPPASGSSRLDWKRDMIELPDERVIAALGAASGIDARKFELIAAVFPSVFATVPTEGTTHVTDNSSNYTSRWRSSPKDPVAQLSSTDAAASYTELSSSRPYSSVGRISRSTPGTPEPATEHEYDPNRPADFGKIIESHQVTRSTSPRRVAAFDGIDEQPLPANGPASAVRDYYPSSHGRHEHSGAYSDQLLRHHDRQGRKTTVDDITSVDSPMANLNQSYVGLAPANGIGSETSVHQERRPHPSGRDETDEVDRFLNAVVPDFTQSKGPIRAREPTHSTIASAGPPRHQSVDRGRQPEVVTLSHRGTPEARTSNAEKLERNGRLSGGALRGHEDSASYSGGHPRSESRPQIIYIRENDSGYQQSPSHFTRDRPSQITFLGSHANRGARAARSDYDSEIRASTPLGAAAPRESYQAVYRQASPSRPVLLEDGRIIVTERNDWQQVHNEHARRPVEYIRAVQRDSYDGPRYYVAQRMDPAPGGDQPQYIYESEARGYIDEHREPEQANQHFVRY